MSTSAAFDRLERLLGFPVDFPIKVIGRRVDGFAQAVCDTVREHVGDFDPATTELRSSSGGKYLSLTVVARLHSRAQLEALHDALSRHPLVRIVL